MKSKVTLAILALAMTACAAPSDSGTQAGDLRACRFEAILAPDTGSRALANYDQYNAGAQVVESRSSVSVAVRSERKAKTQECMAARGYVAAQ